MSEPFQTCLQITTAVQGGERSARAIADEALGKAERLQEKWRAFIKLTPELARKQADRVDAIVGMGRKLPLAGVPFAVKDVIDVKGIPTTCGSRVFSARIAEHDATVVKKLVAVGAVCLGKLNMHECGFGFTGENPHFGDCKNPWDEGRISGGSSSGSAVAVSLGICPFALGSDTGGSIRLPAALCGLVGLKPTYGRVSRAGVAPLSWSMDHVGPMTRTVEDNALILRVLSGNDAADQSTVKQPMVEFVEELKKSVTGMRLGVPQNWFFENLEPEVAAAVQLAIEQLIALGARRVDCRLPMLDEVVGAHRAIIYSEASTYHRRHLEQHGGQYSAEIRHMLQAGLFISSADYLHAQRVRRVVRENWAKTFTEFDVLVTPTAPITATLFHQSSVRLPRGDMPLLRAFLDFTLPFNLTGYPALSIPCGFSSNGLPIGMQLVARPYDEAAVLRMAHHYQSHTDWHRRPHP